MALTKVSYSMIDSAPKSVLDYGAVGDGITDDTVAIQQAITDLAINGGYLVFPYRTYLITSQIILPFGNNDEGKMYVIDCCDSIIKSNVASPTGATFIGLISGYLNGTTPVANVSGSETQVASNIVLMNLQLRGFGQAIRLHNFNYGCALQNILTNNCHNGVNLTRCFYLIVDALFLRGTGIAAAGVGFKTLQFSNIIPMSGIKTTAFGTGMELGGFDGGKMTDCSAENCGVGIEMLSECTAIHLDTIYLEANTISNLKFASTIRRMIISNSWFAGAATQHFTSAVPNSEYVNLTIISTRFENGITNSPPIANIFGDIINSVGDPTNLPVLSGVPNIQSVSAQYELDTSALGFNGPVRSLDSRNTSGLIATAYGGRFRNGTVTGQAPYQTIVNNAGSLEFTTQFVNDGFTALLWRVEISHSVGTYSETFLVFFDNAGNLFRLYRPTAAGLTVDATVTCTNNGGFLMLKAPIFTNPSLIYSIVRTM